MSTLTAAGLDIDLDLATACEHSEPSARHVAGQPAKYLVRAVCTGCLLDLRYLVCQSGWDQMTTPGVRLVCLRCGRRDLPRDCLTVLAVL
ncbi:MAG: hypothetical protein ACOYY2_02970 [Actinomycetota bacterium]